MARRQNVALDRAQAKAKKQKRVAIVLCALFALILVYEVPHTLKLMHPTAAAPVVNSSASAAPAPNPTSTTPAPTNAPVVPSPATSSTPTSSLVAAITPVADPGQLSEFARFASKDPFDPKIQNSSAAPSSTSSSTHGASPKKATPPSAPPKAPPAPPPTSAVISVDGELMSVSVGSDFPTAGTVFNQVGSPLFHLVSLTQATAKVAIAGGSYADGAATLKLMVGTPVTLQNTANGARYTLLLEPQGTQVPTSTAPTSTTPATTTPATTTPTVVPPASSGG